MSTATQTGYNVMHNGEFHCWFALSQDVFNYLNEVYHPQPKVPSVWAVYDCYFNKPKLVLLMGDINSTNKLAVEIFDNA